MVGRMSQHVGVALLSGFVNAYLLSKRPIFLLCGAGAHRLGGGYPAHQGIETGIGDRDRDRPRRRSPSPKKTQEQPSTQEELALPARYILSVNFSFGQYILESNALTLTSVQNSPSFQVCPVLLTIRESNCLDFSSILEENGHASGGRS